MFKEDKVFEVVIIILVAINIGIAVFGLMTGIPLWMVGLCVGFGSFMLAMVLYRSR